MFEEKIKKALTQLAEVGTVLSELQYAINELNPNGVEKNFTPFNFPGRFPDFDVLQFNEKHTSADKEEENMLIDIPGTSVGNKPRSDGRFQGYIIINNKKHYVYGKTKKDVYEKIKKVLESGWRSKRRKPETVSSIPSTFNRFTLYYFEKFRQKKVAEKTMSNDMNRYKNHIEPYFGEMPIRKITPGDCQTLLDSIEKKGYGKTVDEIYSLLNIIFKGAILHNIIKRNPLDIVFHQVHERQHGKAFTKEELKVLFGAKKDERSQQTLALMLMTGLRPNEVKTARIDGPFIVAVNSKRHNKKIEYKKIPIIEELKPFIENGLNVISYMKKLNIFVRKVFPEHKLYDLRTTFYSTCKECGVSEPALKEFVGHSSGALANAYTSLSDEYLIREAEKIRFYLTF